MKLDDQEDEENRRSSVGYAGNLREVTPPEVDKFLTAWDVSTLTGRVAVGARETKDFHVESSVWLFGDLQAVPHRARALVGRKCAKHGSVVGLFFWHLEKKNTKDEEEDRTGTSDW